MDETFDKTYDFGDFRLSAEEKTLFRGDEIVHLPPKVFDTLLLLVENAGRIVSKDEILQTVWTDSFVEENNLQQHISLLRKLLDDAGMIITVPKRGYRFSALVQRTNISHNTSAAPLQNDYQSVKSERFVPSQVESDPSDIRTIPQTQYVKSGDVNIAYQVLGSGELDIVFVMGWVSHLEYFWKEPHFADFLHRLASFSRLILFDKRGTGLSDSVPINQLPTLEQRMDDVRAVMNAVGSKRAVLIGVSEGGPMCSLFAATYPEKTSALVMIGSYAKRLRDEDYPWGVSKEDHSAFFELMQKDWGKAIGLEERAPTLANNEDFRQWWATYLRMGASPGAAVALTKMNAEIDVRNILPSIRVPTLVIHRKNDLCLKVEEGRFLAGQIPAAKFVELEGIDHLPFVGDQQEILDEIEEFLTGDRHTPPYDRVLATVLKIKFSFAEEANFTNRNIFLTNSHLYVRRQLELFKGRQIAYDATGLLAVFDGPARAIRCALAINDSAQRLKIPLQTGLHTGECDVINDTFGGLAVRLAEEIADQSNTGEILVSQTIKDLVAGSGIEFANQAVKKFSGIEGSWRIFKVNK